MKVKIIIFTAFFLAAASLGLALPSLPSDKPSPSKAPIKSPIATPPIKAPVKNPITQPSSIGTLADTPVGKALGGGIGDLSKSCQTALFTIVTSPEFLQCIPAQSIVPLLPIITDPTIFQKFLKDPKNNYKAIEGPFVQFSKLFCPAQKCSDKGVAGAVKTLQDGCAEDLKNKNQIVEIIFAAAVFYSPLHDNICFETKRGKVDFCWDESILTVINLPPSPFKLTGNPLIDSIAVADPDAICTKCNKDMVNTFFNYLAKSDLKDIALQILAQNGVDQKALDGFHVGSAVKCGLEFIDGKIP